MPASSSDGVVEALIAQNALLVNALTARERPPTDLGVLLAGGGGGADGTLTGARGAAALEVQRAQLEDKPQEIIATLRRNLAKANGTAPGGPQDAVEFYRRHGCYKFHQDAGYCASAASEIWNELEMGRTDLAQARLGLLIMSLDQLTRDDRWDVSFLMIHAAEPEYTALYRAPPRGSLRANSRLAEPRWVAAAQAYAKDQAATVEARRKLGKGGGKTKEDDA